jgi:DNA-binding MarR family transcriptional regulator
MSSTGASSNWRFLTNHTQVLLCIARDPDIRLRDIAEQVGITERAAQRILSDLIEVGAVERERHGRRNRYLTNKTAKMRHEAQDGQAVGELLDHLRFAGAPKNLHSNDRHPT